MIKAIKKWWNTPITWGTVTMSSLIGTGITAACFGLLVLALRYEEKRFNQQMEDLGNEETEEE